MKGEKEDCPNPEEKNLWLRTRSIRGADYDAVYIARAQAGEDVHGEANLVMELGLPKPFSVLDAGCGTGRVAIELARRGVEVLGVDIDQEMLDQAQDKAPHLDWQLGDLAELSLGRRFDVIVMAGNVMIFLAPDTEARVVANMARHLAPGGLLVAGFQLAFAFGLEEYDAAASAARLTLVERWSTWDRAPWTPLNSYAVSVHQQK